jgi:formylmethanofuran dehydrogenase subunit E
MSNLLYVKCENCNNSVAWGKHSLINGHALCYECAIIELEQENVTKTVKKSKKSPKK